MNCPNVESGRTGVALRSFEADPGERDWNRNQTKLQNIRI